MSWRLSLARLTGRPHATSELCCLWIKYTSMSYKLWNHATCECQVHSDLARPRRLGRFRSLPVPPSPLLSLSLSPHSKLKVDWEVLLPHFLLISLGPSLWNLSLQTLTCPISTVWLYWPRSIIAVIRIMLRVRVTVSGGDNGGAGGGDSDIYNSSQYTQTMHCEQSLWIVYTYYHIYTLYYTKSYQ